VSAEPAGSQLALSLARFRRLLAVILAVVIYAGLAVEFADDVLGLGELRGLQPFFSLSHEENLPTWLSACLLFSCAVTLVLIALVERRRGARFVRHWWVLALVFFYISLDESATIHEHANAWFRLPGIFYFG
jgi:hypothetical protein